MKVALYGGTFDPIHLAHLVIAEHAVQELSLNRLIFMPAFVSPHKTNQQISDGEHRLQMVQLATANNDCFNVSDYELKKGGTSYTVKTLQCLSYNESLDREHIFLLIGADNLAVIDKWRQPERIFELCQVVVAGRPEYSVDQQKSPFIDQVRFLDSPLLDISASKIRDQVSKGKSIKYLVPASVEDYIYAHKLYQ